MYYLFQKVFPDFSGKVERQLRPQICPVPSVLKKCSVPVEIFGLGDEILHAQREGWVRGPNIW